MEFEIRHHRVGPIQTNCYILVNKETNQGVIIDPGDEPDRIVRDIQNAGIEPMAILLTHGHYDHITGVPGVRKAFDIPVYIHENEREMIESSDSNPFLSGGDQFSVKADEYIKGEPVLDIAGFKIKVYTTPGHTPGGVCYHLPEQKILFSGDTLFCGSVGRTDFPGGSMSQLVRSIKDKLFALDDDTKVYPGHDRETSIAFEKNYNPFLD